MKSRKMLTCALTVAAIALLSVLSVRGQLPASSDEAKIRSLRTNIQRMVENAPPRDAPEESSYQNSLTSLRRQLQRLLIEKIGALKSRIQNLDTPDALPEVVAHIAQLKGELQSVNDEVERMDRALAGSPVTNVLPPAPVPSPATQQPPAPVLTEHEIEVAKATRADFVQAVNNLTADPKKLNEAAAPKVAAETTVPPQCNEAGLAVGPNVSNYDSQICQLARDLNDADRDDRRILLELDKGQLLPILIAKLLKTAGTESYVAMVTKAQEERIDQQLGAGPSSSGTTSLVSKGGIPYLLGFAVENGAAVESRSGTTVTFRFNPAGVAKLFEKKGFITGFREVQEDPIMNFLKKTSVGLSFDTDRGNQPGTFTADGQQLSSISARIEFMNERDPRHKKYAREWEAFVANEGVQFAKNVWATTIALEEFGGRTGEDSFKDPALQAWLVQSNQSLVTITAGGEKLSTINATATMLRARADLLPVKLVAPETIDAITTFARHLKDYSDRKQELLNKIAKGKIFTLDYTNERNINAPDTSNFNFIAATGMGARVDLTANGSFTFFHTRPAASSPTSPRPGRFRDFQFAGQMDIPFRVGQGQFDFWFSGRYERLMADATTVAGATMPGTAGDIAVGQFGLNIPIAPLGIKFPVSVTFANRTELVKEKEIRGNFGFTFNWDTLLSKIKPF